jgi:hypothetical protein
MSENYSSPIKHELWFLSELVFSLFENILPTCVGHFQQKFKTNLLLVIENINIQEAPIFRDTFLKIIDSLAQTNSEELIYLRTLLLVLNCENISNQKCVCCKNVS